MIVSYGKYNPKTIMTDIEEIINLAREMGHKKVKIGFKSILTNGQIESIKMIIDGTAYLYDFKSNIKYAKSRKETEFKILLQDRW
jgi:hypothetical protein